MHRSRFFWKLYAGYVVLILLTAGLIGFVVSRGAARDAVVETERSLLARAALLRELSAPALAATEPQDLQSRIEALGEETGTRLSVILANGKVIADSEAPPESMDNHGSRPEILAAREFGTGKNTRSSNTVGKTMMYAALPVLERGVLTGYVRASIPLTNISGRITEIRNGIIVASVFAALAALLIGFWFARRVTRPLITMTSAAKSFAAGQYDHSIKIRSKDEVGVLATAFNQMISQLRFRMETMVLDRNRVVAILSSMVEGVVAVDRDERILHMNDVAADLLAADTDNCIGRRLGEVTTVDVVCETLRRCMREVADVTSEVRIGKKPKQKRIELQSSPLRDGEKQLAGGVLVLHNVTELKRLVKVRRDFVANVSHELKTPVTAIRGLVETLIDDEEMPTERKRDFLSRIKTQSLRLASLISDLLNISRLESGEAILEPEIVDLRDPIHASVSGLQAVIYGKKIGLSIDLPSDPALIVGDNEMVRHISDNLLDNAAKYTPSGGQINLRLVRGDRFYTLEVKDTGIGIKPKHQARIFERFYRVDKARSRKLGGTGLGLSIVRNSAYALGGDVEVRSIPGKGSSFRVRLPVPERSSDRTMPAELTESE